MGFVDRGGGREAKGASLRRSTKNPGAAATRARQPPRSEQANTPPTRHTPHAPTSYRRWLRRVAAAAAAHARNNKEDDVACLCTRCLVPVMQSIRSSNSSSGSSSGGTLAHDMDASVALLARKLQDEMPGVLQRAASEGGLVGLLCWHSEVERQAALLDACRQHNKLHKQQDDVEDDDEDGRHGDNDEATASTTTAQTQRKHVRFQLPSEGNKNNDSNVSCAAHVRDEAGGPACVLYCLAGVHVNSIDRTHRKVQQQWIDELSTALATQAEVLGVLSGLSLARDVGTHYTQEWLLQACWRVASTLHMPLCLHLDAPTNNNNNTTTRDGSDGDSCERTGNRLVELLHELLTMTTQEQAAQEQQQQQQQPSALVLAGSGVMQTLARSSALREFVRTHRPASCAAAAATMTTTKSVQGDTLAVYVMVHADMYTTSREDDNNEDDSATTQADGAECVALHTLLPRVTYTTTGDDSSNNNDNDSGDCHSDADDDVVALSQLLVCTHAPLCTPQTLSDAYVRSRHNEPANYPAVVEAVHAAMLQQRRDTCADKSATAAASTRAQDTPCRTVHTLTARDVADVAAYNFARVFFADDVAAVTHTQQQTQQEQQQEDKASTTDEAHSTSNSVRNTPATATTSTASHTAVDDTEDVVYTCVHCRSALFAHSAVLTHIARNNNHNDHDDDNDGSNATRRGKHASARNNNNNKQRKKNKNKQQQQRRHDNDKDDDDDDDSSHHDTSTHRDNVECTAAYALRVLRDGVSGNDDEADNNSSSGGPLLVVDAVAAPDAYTRHATSNNKRNDDVTVTSAASAADTLTSEQQQQQQTQRWRAMRVRDTTVLCTACGAKLGTVQRNTPCHCGHYLAGATARIIRGRVECAAAAVRLHTRARTTTTATTTSAATSSTAAGNDKDDGAAAAVAGDEEDGDEEGDVDVHTLSVGIDDGDDTLRALLAAAARERERIAAEGNDGGDDKDDGGAGGSSGHRQRQRKKNVKANNRSNFTHFRNKNFAPRSGNNNNNNNNTHDAAHEAVAASDDSNSDSDA